MGCNIGTKFRRPIESRSSLKLIILQPGNFINENSSKFADIYRIGKVIGTGAYGEVRICFHRDTNTKRAVKIIRKDLITSQSIRANLDKEISILKSLDHPNIIKIFEYFEEIKRLYIVMEFCKGGELFAEIVKRKYLSEIHAAHIMQQLFGTLEYLHSKKIAHRDLKPENILLEEKHDVMNIKIIDFGAAAISDGQPLTEVVGTIFYIAPEVLLGNYTHLCDMWSSGVILYILLTGYPPFDGKSDSEMTLKIKEGSYNMTQEPWPLVSNEVKSLIHRLLCPAKRRVKAREALNDPWILKNAKRDLPGAQIMSEALANLVNFRSKSILKEAVNTFIITQCISAADIKELRDVFRAMDKNGDGKLSKEELLEEYKKLMEATEAIEQVNKVFNEVDTDNNGFIEYSEFLKGSLDTHKLLSAENLKKAFKKFDEDGSGTISALELKRLMSGGLEDNKIWNEIILEVDQNGDGEIDMQEFQKILFKNHAFST